MIKIKNIDKYYFKRKSNEIHVLNDINLEFEEKGLITILGPSGSGKSTLLHVIGGLDKAHGQITYDDYVFDKFCNNKMDLYRNKYIGYIFQNYNLNKNETCFENVANALYLCGVTDKDIVEKRVLEALKNGTF